MTKNKKLGKYVAIRTLAAREKHMLPIQRGAVVEVEQTSTDRLLAVSGSAIWGITKSDIAAGGALLPYLSSAERMMTLEDAKQIVANICDGLAIQAEDDNSDELLDIAIDLNDRVSRASDTKELLLALEIADAELEQLGGLNETIEGLRDVAKEIA